MHSLGEALDRAVAEERDAWSALRAFVLWAGDSGRGVLAAVLAGVPEEATVGPGFEETRQRWLERFTALVRQAQADGRMRADVGGWTTWWRSSTCSPAIPARCPRTSRPGPPGSSG
ncbi:hypothetical protein ACFSTC_23630 [Nonomuraea ferruginea]